jgi:hypothetical protein
MHTPSTYLESGAVKESIREDGRAVVLTGHLLDLTPVNVLCSHPEYALWQQAIRCGTATRQQRTSHD